MSRRIRRMVRPLLPAGFLAAAIYPWRGRWVAAAGLVALWGAIYARYRRTGLVRMQRERELLERVTPEAFSLHYNERVPTIEEEFEIWGVYHRHRHEMRYDLVASAVREHLPGGGRVLDLGCGAALVADRIADIDAHYVGMDFGGPHIAFAATKYATSACPLSTSFARGDGEALPFAGESFDVIVMSEVIEHLLYPQLAIWEVARVMRRGGVFIMTTNNASEVPLRSPLTDPLSWVEKAVGSEHPKLISHRPWVWHERVDPVLLPPGSPDVHVPHTHHIYAETSALFSAAGLQTIRWSTFEFPPPQSRTARLLERLDGTGRRAADAIESVARRTPLLWRMGTHLFMVARKTSDAIAADPPPDIWPGPPAVAAERPSAG